MDLIGLDRTSVWRRREEINCVTLFLFIVDFRLPGVDR